MVKLLDKEIATREVLGWDGLNILHGRTSSCSQKLRIFLNLKGIDWSGREFNLAESETYTDWFLGVNPRGLVPVLIWDGEVHVESNDILALLEERFPEPCLFPLAHREEIAALLRFEDDLHLDLRRLSMRFVFGRDRSNKTEEMFQRYQAGDRTVAGVEDHETRAMEMGFYQRMAAEGITDAAARESAAKFRAAYDDLERRLASDRYFLGPDLSIMDIAWYVYTARLGFGGYPFERLHPRVHAWFTELDADERFSREVALPPPVHEARIRNHAAWETEGRGFSQVMGW